MKKALFLALLTAPLVAACGDESCLQQQDLRCLPITCSDHGTCVIMDDKPTCICDEGYHNENDTSCVPDFGTCEGAADGVFCDDGLFCTVGETCRSGVCTGGVERNCSDGDPCTVDSCDETSDICLYEELADGRSCDDGRWCTTGETCQAGVCSGGEPRDCDDADPCTLDVCDNQTRSCQHPAAPDDTPCDDGLFCTTTEVCRAGSCQPLTFRVCNDANPCTLDLCDEVNDVCSFTAVAENTPCDDGQWCTVGEICSGGACAGGMARNCSDGSACTEDSCDEDNDRCLNLAVTDNTPCDDGAWCTVGEKCVAGVCGQGAARDCDDFDPCTADVCDEAADQCLHDVGAADGTPCDDGEFCTVADTCLAGTCSGVGRNCSDGNPCTIDSCDEQNDTCVNDTAAANGLACNDGAFCTEGEVCNGGNCGGGTPRTCSDGNPCTQDRCDEVNDLCINDPLSANGLPCDDGLFCNVGETCSNGSCLGGGPRNCSDDHQCTVDSCNENTDQCDHSAAAANGMACEDGAFCTTGETCLAGACQGGTPRNCSDGNTCTVDSCNEASDTCEHDPVAANGTPCDDGAYCTLGETCANGVCTGGAPRDCADTDPCTFDMCNEVLDRCDNNAVPNGTPCDDGQYCTVGEACSGGNCGGGIARNCSDGNQCTADSCNENLDRCENNAIAMNGQSCNDGLYCLVGETCQNGNCGGGIPFSCNDNIQCTLDFCDEVADSCQHDGPAMNGVSCDDGNWCIVGETCNNGNCSGTPRDCDEGNSCTTDICNEQYDRCDHTNLSNGSPCDDGQFCTVGDNCQNGVCQSGNGFACGDGNPCTVDSCDEVHDICSFSCVPAGTRCFSPTQQVTCDGACNASGLVICPYGCNSSRQECNECNPSTVECRADIEYLCNAEFVCNAQGQIVSKTCCSSNRCTCNGLMCLEDVCASATDVSAGGVFNGNTCNDQDNVPGDCFPGGPACRSVAQGGSPEEFFRFTLNDGLPTSRFYNVTLASAGYDTSLRVSTICGSETEQVPYAEVCTAPAGILPLQACSEESGPEGMVLCGMPEGTFYGTVDSAPGVCGAYSMNVSINAVNLDVPTQAGNISLGGVFTGNTCSLADNFSFPDTQLINGCSGLGNCAAGSDPRACPRCDVSAATDCNIPMNASDSLCAYSGVGSRDAVFYLALPVASGVDISTVGSDFDTVLYIMQTGQSGAQPPGAARICNDDCYSGSGVSHIQTALPAGLYYVYLDGAGGACGNYQLNVIISPSANCPNLGCEFPEENCRTCPFDCPCPNCGDGVVDNAAGEECDDGDFIDNDGCTRCAVDYGWHCSGQPSNCVPIFQIDRTSNCNCSIPDLGTRTDVINVPTACTILGINVDMNITHTWRGDLSIDLRAPDGTTVRLKEYNSSDSADNVIGNYEQTMYVDGPGAMADFIGHAGNGNWTLTINDWYLGDTGTLNSWALHLTCY